MQKFSLDFSETNLHNNIITDYLQQKDSVKPFYQYAPSLDAFAGIIEERKKFPFHRDALVSTLKKQYAEVATVNEVVRQNIDALANENTYR